MTKKERVEAAVNGLPVDKIPASFWRHFTQEEMVDGDFIRAHRDFYDRTDMDFIKIMHDGFTAPFDLNAATVQGLRSIRSTKGENAYIQAYLRRAVSVNNSLRGEVHTYANLFAPFMLLRKIGDDRLHALIGQDESAVRSALDAISDDLCYLTERLLTDCGCFGVFVCFQGAEPCRFTETEFAAMERPADVRVLKTANCIRDVNIAHLCAWDQTGNDLARWRDYPAKVINWAIYADRMSLEEGMPFFGERPVLGGFDNRREGLLYTAPRDMVEAETRRIVGAYRRAHGSANGLIVGADCSFLPDFDLERFTWVTDTLHLMAKEGGIQ